MLPSKKIIPIFLACGIATASIVFAVTYTPKQQESSRPTLAAIAGNGQQRPVIDVENTELKNWQETLKKLNSANGVEISETGTSTLQITDQTATNQLAREVFSSYMALKKTDQDITLEDEQDVVTRALMNAQLKGAIPLTAGKIYTEYDLNISQDQSLAALKQYGNAVGSVFSRNRVPAGISEMLVLEKMVDNQDRSQIANLDIIITSYKHIIAGLLETPVPADLAPAHLAVINSFSKTIAVDENMKKTFDDPVMALAAVTQYQEVAQMVARDISAVYAALRRAGVVYARGELGYAMTNAL